MSIDSSCFRQLIFQNEIQVEAPSTQPDQFMLAHQFRSITRPEYTRPGSKFTRR